MGIADLFKNPLVAAFRPILMGSQVKFDPPDGTMTITKGGERQSVTFAEIERLINGESQNQLPG